MRFTIGVVWFCIMCSTVFADPLPLTIAAKRNPEITKLQRMCSAQKAEWANFLLKNMPTGDAMSLIADSLFKELEAIEHTQKTVPWASKVPKSIFTNYVLPITVSQEPLEYFVSNYGAELLARVKDCTDIKQAIYAVNEWASEQMHYEPTMPWDYNAHQTVVRGVGRCEEMAILFIKACRAVGIPARNAYTPYWSFSNSNHAWVEVWTEQGWRHIGGGELTPLGGGWFASSAAKTAIVKAIATSKLDSADMPIYSSGANYTILNSTPIYSDTTGLTISISDGSKPLDSVEVWISVYNFGCPRAVARAKTDKTGKVHFALGKCDVLISAARDSLWNFTVHSFLPNDTVAEVEMHLTRNISDMPDTGFWLRVADGKARQADSGYVPSDLPSLRHEIKRQKISAASQDFIALLPETSSCSALASYLNAAGLNRAEYVKFFKAHADEREAILKALASMDLKDICLLDSAQLELFFAKVKSRKQMFNEQFHEQNDDSLFYNYVAAPRIFWENFALNYVSIEKFVREKKLSSVSNFKMAAQSLDSIVDASYFGGMMNVSQVLLANGGSKIEKLCVFVALCRNAAIPARICWDMNSAEFFDSANGWTKFVIDTQKDAAAVQTGACEALFFDSAPRTDLKSSDDFCIVRLENGVFQDLDPPSEKLDSTILFKDLPCGTYAFTSGFRNAKGEVFCRIMPFKIDSSNTTFVRVKVGFPDKNFEPKDLLVRNLDNFSRDSLAKAFKMPIEMFDSQFVVAIFDPVSEKSLSTANALSKVRDIRVFAIVIGDKNDEKSFFEKTKLEPFAHIFSNQTAVSNILPYKELPSIAMFENTDPILWTEGLNLLIESQISTMIMQK